MTPRHICLSVVKTEPGPHWGKLLKAAGKPPHYVKVDWSKYKDEEEEETEGQGAAAALHETLGQLGLAPAGLGGHRCRCARASGARTPCAAAPR